MTSKELDTISVSQGLAIPCPCGCGYLLAATPGQPVAWTQAEIEEARKAHSSQIY